MENTIVFEYSFPLWKRNKHTSTWVDAVFSPVHFHYILEVHWKSIMSKRGDYSDAEGLSTFNRVTFSEELKSVFSNSKWNIDVVGSATYWKFSCFI